MNFALGYAGSISGPIRNPYDPRRHANGSSGGTGAGIAADFATVGIGEDTGGSIRGPAAAAALVGHRPTVPLVSRYGVMPSRPSADTVGPIARTGKDAAIVLDVIAGYDPSDPVTAYSVGRLTSPTVASLKPDALRGARFALISQAMSPSTDATSSDFSAVRTVLNQAVNAVRSQGAEVLTDINIPRLPDRLKEAADAGIYETDAAIDGYLAWHPNAPFKTLRAILQTGHVLPWRARTLTVSVGRSVDEPEFGRLQRRAEDTRIQLLALMATHKIDAFIYASSDHSPGLVAADVMTNPAEGDTRHGSNRALAPWVGFPATVVPAGFTPDGLPVGLEIMGRAFDDAKILAYAFAFEQATRHRQPPPATPRLQAH
nr:Putative amidase AmiD [uncultured bacterium]